MKRLLASAAAVLMLAGCSHDLTVEKNNGREIDFRTPSFTKGYVLDEGTLNTFHTFAFTEEEGKLVPYFENVCFSLTGLLYTSTPFYYWPANNEDLHFYCYAPKEGGLNPVFDQANQTLTIADFAPAEDISDHVDFITSYVKSNMTDGAGGVDINFNHRLSMLSVHAVNTNDSYVYKVKGVRLGGFLSKGSYTFSPGSDWDSDSPYYPEEGTWTIAADAQKVTYENQYDPISVSSVSSNLMGPRPENISGLDHDFALVIPQDLMPWDPDNDKTNADEGAYVGLLVNITTKDEAPVYPAAVGEYGWVAYPLDTDLQVGYHYKYTLDLSAGAGYVAPDVAGLAGTRIGNQIKLKVEVNDFEDGESSFNRFPQYVGVWTANKFEMYDEDGNLDENIENDVVGLQHVIGDFWKFEINSDSSKLIALQADGTPTGNEAELKIDDSGENDKFYISGMDPVYVEVVDIDKEAGTATICIDYIAQIGGDNIQYIYYTLE